MIAARFILSLGLLIVLSFQSQIALAQGSFQKVRFANSTNSPYGFDGYSVVQWKNQYAKMITDDSVEFRVGHKSVLRGSSDFVNLILDPSAGPDPKFSFLINDTLTVLNSKRISKDTIQLELPKVNSDYVLKVFLNTKFETAIRVHVYKEMSVKVRLVPLVNEAVDRDSLMRYLNRVYGQAGVRIDLSIDSTFDVGNDLNRLLANPSANHDRYTEQMIEIRNEYFDAHGTEKGTYYVFLVKGFVSQEISGYMVRNKGVGFVKFATDDLYREVAHQLGYGLGQFDDLWKNDGPNKGTTKNLMDISGTRLSYQQWELLRKSGKTVSYYDDFEDVRTNNGIIGFYLWEERADGTIVFLGNDPKKGITRAFKRNTYSLHLNIDNFLFYQMFTVWEYPICFLHLLGLCLMALSSILVRRYTVKKVAFIQKRRLMRFFTRMGSFSIHLWFFWLLFLLVNEGYFLFEVDSGKIDSLQGMNVREAKLFIRANENTRRNEENHLGSEILIKKGKEWFLEKRQRVLYFDVTQTKGKTEMRYKKDDTELFLRKAKFRKKAHSHYFVFRYLDEDGKLTSERVFNHIGVDITDKLTLDDPAERVLVFVNGYRPTSLGSSFEENFKDIQNNGFEYKNSNNLIYTFDRYEYWRPWHQIDLKFQRRLNPTKTLYADGHHSVTTSNHGNIIDFTRLSLNYPKRCKNRKKHVCRTTVKGWKWLGMSRKVPTYESMHLEPNEDGFKLRKQNGKIAGRNLYQMLNELPSYSRNDTLYIVAHSMGYAYTLGMIQELRGKINFGGLYIIAAENAESGRLVQSEWQEVWQYGSDFEAHKLTEPCLLDGIAPQTKAGGLSPRNRIYIPEFLYKKMGFFDSHFIGNYTWIFDVPKDAPGHIKQR